MVDTGHHLAFIDFYHAVDSVAALPAKIGTRGKDVYIEPLGAHDQLPSGSSQNCDYLAEQL